jgi:DNA-binding transcriptional regulator LsrR (DeoR family)
MSNIEVSKEQLIKLYLVENKTQDEIANILNISKTSVCRKLKSYSIKKEKVSKEVLEQLYIIDSKTQSEIASILNTSRATIGNYLKQYNINKKSKIEIYTDEVINLYNNNFSTYYISNKLDCSLSTIEEILKRNNLKNNKTIYNSISKDELYTLYIEKNLTQEQIAVKLHTSTTNINKHLKDYNVKKQRQLEVNISLLIKYYIEEDKTQKEVALLLGIKESSLQNIIKRHNIVKKTKTPDKDTLKYLCDKELTIDEISKKVNYSRTYTGQLIQKYNIDRDPLLTTSLERFIKNYLDNNNIDYIQNDRYILEGKELDFYLIEHDLGIEICGLYWHSTKIHKNKYHINNKHNLCKNIGLELITIFEDEIISTPDIIINRLNHKLNLNTSKKKYARNSTIKTIDSNIGITFLNNNHIQGSGRNSIYLGSFIDNKLVSVMSFSKKNIAKGSANVEYELNRFAVSEPVIGVASKLFSYFIKKYNPTSIISYADKRWNTGNLYEKLGFSYSHDSNPNYWYIVQQSRKHRFSYRKSILLTHFNNDMSSYTEEELAEMLDLYRIYDCGNKVFIWRNTLIDS